jgi:hypothetical protein
MRRCRIAADHVARFNVHHIEAVMESADPQLVAAHQ